MKRLITVDPEKILAKIQWHREQAKELNLLLDRLNMLREFSPSTQAADGNGRGRPAKENHLIKPLREFVEAQTGDFNHHDLKVAVGNPARKDRVRDAIKTLKAQGVLEIIEKPNGRFQGVYRRKNQNKEMTKAS